MEKATVSPASTVAIGDGILSKVLTDAQERVLLKNPIVRFTVYCHNAAAAGVPVAGFVHGPPGIGKTAMTYQAGLILAKRYGKAWHGVIPFRLGQAMDVTELIGIPTLAYLDSKAGKWIPLTIGQAAPSGATLATVFIPPVGLPREGAGIVFFDEYNLGDQPLQNGSRQVLDERRLSRCDWELPRQYGVMAAGNSMKDAAAVYAMDKVVNRRFHHREALPPTVDEWLAYGDISGTILPSVAAFHKFCDQQNEFWLYRMPTEEEYREEEGWANHAAWERASRAIAAQPAEWQEDRDFCAEIVRDSVGPEAGAKYKAFVDLQLEACDPEEALHRPDTCTIPPTHKVSLRFAFVGAVAHYAARRILDAPAAGTDGQNLLGKESDRTITPLLTICKRFDQQLAYLILRLARAEGGDKFVTVLADNPLWKKDPAIQDLKRYLV